MFLRKRYASMAINETRRHVSSVNEINVLAHNISIRRPSGVILGKLAFGKQYKIVLALYCVVIFIFEQLRLFSLALANENECIIMKRARNFISFADPLTERPMILPL